MELSGSGFQISCRRYMSKNIQLSCQSQRHPPRLLHKLSTLPYSQSTTASGSQMWLVSKRKYFTLLSDECRLLVPVWRIPKQAGTIAGDLTYKIGSSSGMPAAWWDRIYEPAKCPNVVGPAQPNINGLVGMKRTCLPLSLSLFLLCIIYLTCIYIYMYIIVYICKYILAYLCISSWLMPFSVLPWFWSWCPRSVFEMGPYTSEHGMNGHLSRYRNFYMTIDWWPFPNKGIIVVYQPTFDGIHMRDMQMNRKRMDMLKCCKLPLSDSLGQLMQRKV